MSLFLVNGTAQGQTADFGDYTFGSASSTVMTTLKIGATTDKESAATTNASATGDDTTGSDDEDGVTVPASVALGVASSLTVNVTNTSGATAYLNVWIDFNRNGVLTDSGEQVAVNTTIATGTSNSNKTVSFTVPATASVGTAGVRVRLTSTSSPTSTGLSGNGEVEDYVMTLACPTVTLGPATLTAPTVGTAYSATLSATGSTTTFTYSVTSGSLPAGLTLNASTGVISGTPTSTTTANFTITATGANTCAGSQAYAVTPVCPTVSLTLATIPDAYVGSAYSQTITASGGTTPYTYAVSSGSLPSGLSLSTGGVLTGTPGSSNGAGANVSIRATDARGCQGALTYVVQVCPVISISPTSLSNGTVGTAYSQTITATGGTSPYTYAVVTGTLPAGLSLASGTGVISGTPTSTATASYTISATDANGCVTTTAYSVTPAATTDFGDYSAFGSAGSTMVSTLKIGTTTDTEMAATTNATATGDDITGSDDEDGVTVPSSLTQATSSSLTVNVTNTSGASAFVNVWIDFNGNGVLTDSGEQVATNTVIATGTSNASRTVSFQVPALATVGAAGVRVRLTSTSSPGPTGTSGNGEVEDYVTNILAGSSVLSRFNIISKNAISVDSSSLSTGRAAAASLSLISTTMNVGGTASAPDGASVPSQYSLAVQNSLTMTSSTIRANSGSVYLSPSITYTSSSFQYPSGGGSTVTTAAPDFSGIFTAMNAESSGYATLAANSTVVISGSTYTLRAGTSVGTGVAVFSLTVADINSASFVLDTNGQNPRAWIVNVSGTGNATFGSTTVGSEDQWQDLLFNFYQCTGTVAINSSTMNASVLAPSATISIDSTTKEGSIAGNQVVIISSTIGFPTWTGDYNGTTVGVGNVIYLDANNDGLYTSGEGVNGVTVQLYKEGDTAGVSTPSAATTTASGGKYLFSGLKPARYFVHVPAVNFATGGALVGKASVLGSSWLDDADHGNDSTSPATMGVSTRLFSLTPGAQPTDTTGETGFDAASDNASDDDINLTVDLGFATPSVDYGDYSGFGAVSSTVNGTLKIGATTDVDATPVSDDTATGDDLTGSDDEDGVTVPAQIMLGNTASLTVNVSNTSGATAYLNAWIDFNQNGVLTDSGEQIASNTVISTGSSNSNKTITFTVPSTATLGVTGVRVRLTSTSSPGSTGSIGNGEVEDYVVTVSPSLGIGNMVWNDANENGLFDPEESGINNVLIELWTPGADNAIGGTGSNADTKVASMNTAGGGLYNFSGLAAGRYYVKVPTPPLSRTSLVVDTTDNGQDGDNNASQPGGSSTSAYSPVIQLSPGTEPGSTGTGNIDNTVDFGFASNIGSPFVCDNRFWIVQNAETSAGSGVWDATLYYVGDGPSLVPTFFFDGYKLNGLAAYGGYLYCVDQNGNHLYRINSQGVLVDMGAIPGLPAPGSSGQWSGATALTNGRMILNLYNFSPASTQLYTVDLTSASLVGSPVTVTNTGTGTTYSGNFGDIVWDPLTNKVYGYSTVDTSWLGLFEINITTGAATRVSSAVPGAWGSMIIDANGLTYGFGSAGATGNQDTLYVFNRTSGVLNGSITAVGTGPAVSNSDGAACPGAAPSMKLGSLVWNDADNDGFKDVAESGIDGVTLQLFLGGQNPLTAAPAATVTTYGGGLYTFNNLSPGQYFIYMPTPPAAYPMSSTTTVTADNGVDNDDNGIQTSKGQPVQSPLIALAGGTESITDGDTDSNTDLTIDFGFFLPATDYGDYPGFAAASQIASADVRVGTNATDAEGLNPSTGTANVDDTTDTDDEDLVMPSVVSGGDATLNLTATLSGSTTQGRIAIWADWNGDGDVIDTNETVTLSTASLITGANTITATFSPPAGTTAGTKYLRIRAVEGTTAPVFSGTSSLKGEVEDYAITVTSPTLDYGDLPDTIIGTTAGNYQTLANDNGPTSIANSNLRLGALVDAEGNGQPNSTATGDDVAGVDDDDGVATLPTLTQGQSATLTMTATNALGAAGFLKAWIDWNNDGNLTAGEELGTEISVPNGTSNGSFSFTFTVPGSAVTGTTLGLRIRLASATIPASTGNVGTGEVEDYLVTVNPATTDFGDNPGFAAASRTASTDVRIGTNATDAEGLNPTTGTANADDTTGTDDEDLTMPTLTVGVTGTSTFTVTLSGAVSSGRVAAWADWNGDGDVLDTNETISLSTASLVAGANSITATLSPPSGTTAAVKFLRIIATEGTTLPSFSSSVVLKGEVEDYAITVNAPTLDFGDLPDTGTGTGSGNYQTLNSDSGPSHTPTSTTLRLGATVDTEVDGQPNSTASGDVTDEDGISSMPTFYRGQNFTIPVSVLNNTGSVARVFAFIDFNADGDFADSGETLAAVTVNSSASQQTVNVTGTTPGTAVIGSFGARFRLATATTLGSTGTTSNGEVEDYMVTGACPTLTISPTTLPNSSQYASYAQTVTATGGTAPYTWAVTAGAIPSGLTFSSGGVFSGTVISSSGAYVFTLRATDANGCTASQSYTISVGVGGMSVGNLVFLDENNNGLKDSTERGIPNVPVELWSVGTDGKANSADDQPVNAGVATTLDSGGMMTAANFGSIASGYSTLTARTDWTGAYQFTQLPVGSYYLKVTPPNNSVFSSKFGTGTTTYSLNLTYPLASSNQVLIDNGIDNDSNGMQTSASFTNSSDAVIAGVGAAVFSMPFTLASGTEPGTTNAGDVENTIDFGLRPCPVIGLTSISIPAVSNGVAYSTSLSATGGTAPYTYAITQGTLPTGLSMTTTGAISGTTTTSGTTAVTVRVTDALGCQGFTTIQVSVTSALTITTASLPNGTEGTAYTTTTLSAGGGTNPYQNWRVSTGTLPPGLSIVAGTGVVSGTPTAPGSYTFTVAVDDALVTPASVTVTNGSVETDAWSALAFTPRTSVTGWTLGNSALTGTGTNVQLYGINDTTNTIYGATPAGAQFLASPFVGSWASQSVSGFTVGRPYVLRVRYALRNTTFTHPAVTEVQPPFYANLLWIAGYNGSAATLFGPANVNFPAPTAKNYDNWSTIDVPFVPQTASMVFSYGLEGSAIDDIQFIPTVASTITATKSFTVVIAGNRDWGDLPDTGTGTNAGNYQTLNSDVGPSHYRNTNLRLGANYDIESDGLPNATATGDDINGTPDDEDGVTSIPALSRGLSFTIPVSVFNNTGTSARIFGFIDWNNDGDFLDPSEALTAVVVNTSSAQQSVNVTGTVPGNAVLAQTGIRLRLSSAATLGASGLAADGEVEDYLATVSCPTIAVTPTTLTAGLVGSVYSQTMSASGGTTPYAWSTTTGTLPSGLSLSAGGVVSGTPTAPTSGVNGSSITLRGTDANGCFTDQAVNVKICPVITVTPATLTAPVVGTAYSATMSASGSSATPVVLSASGLASWMTFNTSTGVLSGTPTSTASATVVITATDANGCTGTRSFTITPVCPAISITPTALTAGTVGVAYSQTLAASGGTAPYSSWTITAGTLPAGLTLNASTGIISGTPSASSSPATTITVRVNDTYGCQGTQAVTLQICPVITLAPATPGTGSVGSAYSQTITASGGTAPYTFAVASGTLPAGLALNASTGVVSGTPTTAVSSNVTLRATDANGCQGTLAVTFAISCPVITVAPTTLAQGFVGTAYSQTITASGGSYSYVFAITSGTLPAGLALNSSTGVISGTPTTSNAAGTSITVSATDSFNCSGTKTYTLQICPAVTLNPTSLPTPSVGLVYSQTVTASGGATPYVYAVSSGSLPAGLTLNTSTGVISGTPTSSVSQTFTLRATDASGCVATRAYTLAPACAAITISPTTLNAGLVGTAYSAALSATPTATYSWPVASGTLPTGLSLNGTSGALSGTPTAPGTYNFTVRASTGQATVPQLQFNTYNLDLVPGDTFNIRDYVLPKDGSGSPIDWSSVSFTYTGAGANDPTIPADWNLSNFNAGLPVTVTSADAAAAGNSNMGEFRIYIVRAGQATFDDHMTIRVSASNTSAVNSAKVSPAIPMACSGTRAYSMQICPVITLSPATLANGTINTAYSQTVTAAGGATPYVYAISTGTLPAGLALNTSTGAITGTPTSTSAANFTVRATDANGCTGTQSYTVTPAPDSDYGDFSLFGSASSRMDATIRMGITTDVEAAATTNATATGDDITGTDDEDGVTVPGTITQGAAGSMSVTVTNTSGASAYLNVWIDFNNNGVLTDAGEQITANTLIATGTSNVVRTINFNAPAGATLGVVGVRVRLTSTNTPGPTGASGNGEVEDVVTTIVAPTTDYGDFSLFADAWSTGSTSLRLGALVDLEGASTLNATATGDDITSSDDEDGLTFPSMTAGQPITLPVTVTNNTGATGYLNAWIDFNNNGVLTDAGEQIATNVNIATGLTNSTVNISFTVPTNAVTAATTIGTRFRLTSVATPTPTGAAGTGEVEDHGVTILAPMTDFGDFSGAADASNTASTTLRIGALVDTEYAATKNATATGDDITGSADEDGVAIPAMTAGAPATLPVVVTNTTGSVAYLNAWIDYNNNGVFTDAGEQIATGISITTGTNSATQNLSITVPATAVTGVSVGVRVRLSTDVSAISTGAGSMGEVEDYVVNIAAPTTDFGDFATFGGASSTRNSTLRLGALTDTEYVATTNSTATGDDTTGSDDEDGVTLPAMTAGAPATIPVVVTNTSGASAYLNAWIDYNGNGVLTDAGEQITSNVLIANGTNGATQNLSITVSPTTLTGVNLGVRVRLSSTASPGATGASGNGEVEDYLVNITAPTTDFGDFSGFADASQGASPALRLGALTDTEYLSTLNATATGDNLTGSDDEDGVTIPSMTAGQTVTIPVTVTNTSGAIGYLNAWIDFNNNGVPTDAGEQIATNINVASGTTNSIVNISVTVPTTATTGVNVGARFRFSTPSGLGHTGANGLAGEIEDYVINIAAPTTDFGDFSTFGSASSTRNSTLRLGALVDAEYLATTNTAATGDDTTGSDDEDGVTLPTLSAGLAATIPVAVTNTSGATAYLNAWIDYNNNGVLTDAGEQIATDVSIANGTNGATQNITTTLPFSPVTGTNLGVRFRLTSVASPGATGAVGTGEVEDYIANIVAPTADFGDWSGTADASNTTVSSLRIGALIDSEFSATKDAAAVGDDLTNTDDEDGVTIPAMTAGGTFTIPVLVTNTSGAAAYLNAWIDYNNNGVLTDAGEQIATNVSIATGTNNVAQNLSVSVPTTVVTGTNLGVRVRLTSIASPGVTGTGGGNGEVEDYVTTIAAPTTDQGDFSLFSNASSTANSTLRLGALVDAEYLATTNVAATGDDTTGSDDEDGVTLPSMSAGQTVTIPVVVTNSTGSAAFLNAWIDYNNNGVLTDAGEQVATNVSIATGLNNATQNLSVTVPYSSVTGTNIGVRVRLTSTSAPGPTGASGTGEVEDYIVSIIAPLLDYGDRSGFADAASTASATLRMGTAVDAEFASTLNAAATGDDTTNVDDEDGVTIPAFTAGAPATIPVVVTNTSGAAAFLNAWIDFNNNGVLTDAGEQIATNVSIANGTSGLTQNISVTVPATALTGTSLGVRFRLSSTSSPGATGTIGTGEVEDYAVTIAVPTTDFGDWSSAADASSIANSNLRMGALADTEYVSTLNATATGDDITASDDEDGVTLSALTPSTTGSASVVVTNNSGAAAYLNAWIDFNNNGSFADSGEQIATNTNIATGTNGVAQNVSFSVPAGAVPGQRGARFRFTSTQSPTSIGASGTGEVEDYLVTINCLPVTLSPTTLAVATVGTGYSQTASATGGLAPYVYSVSSGTLPAGLTLNSSTGAITGTPTASTAANFTITATDVYGCAGSQSYSVTPVCPTITVNPSALADGLVGTAYSQTLSASGGTAPYTYALTTGTLPSGLALNTSTGVISGTPTASNAAGVSLTFRATDTYGCTATRTVTLKVCPVLTFAPATLTTPTVGTAYSQTITASGGATPYTYTLASGTLPAWATLSSGGVLSGTPNSTTGATFTVRATDANGCAGTLAYTTTPVCPAITITPAALTQGTVGTAYSQSLSATGGVAPYSSWTITAGALPAGLTLDANTGVISGTPTASASPATTITVRVNDANGCQGSRAITLQICPVITLAPATPTAGSVGSAYSQTITASGGTAPYTFAVASGTLPAGLTLNASTGLSAARRARRSVVTSRCVPRMRMVAKAASP